MTKLEPRKKAFPGEHLSIFENHTACPSRLRIAKIILENKY